MYFKTINVDKVLKLILLQGVKKFFFLLSILLEIELWTSFSNIIKNE